MLKSLVILALVALNIPSVSAASIQSRQAVSNTFIFTTSGNDNCKSIAVSFFDAGQNLIEIRAGLAIDNVLITHTIAQDYVPAFASFRPNCPSSNHNYRIHSVTSYGVTYNSNTAMYLMGENGAMYLPDNKIPKNVGTSIILLNNGKKRDGSWASFNANAFAVKSVSGSGTLAVGLRNSKNYDFAVARIPSTSIVPNRVYVVAGFDSTCHYLTLDWTPNTGGSISVDRNNLFSNNIGKGALIPVDLTCDSGSMVSGGLSNSDVLPAGMSLIKCSAARCTDTIAVGSALPRKFPMV